MQVLVPLTDDIEWLEPDGLGGFASGTAVGRRTRRYHALLLTATSPPTGRYVLVNGFEAWIETESGRVALSSQRYLPNMISPDGERRLRSFSDDPWPRWIWQLDGGSQIELELFVPHDVSACVLRWIVCGCVGGSLPPSFPACCLRRLVMFDQLLARDHKRG